MTDQAPGDTRDIKQERLSPEPSDNHCEVDMGPDNGYHADGCPIDSGEDESGGEAPLDFSMKKSQEQEEVVSGRIARERLVDRLMKPRLELHNGHSRGDPACATRNHGDHERAQGIADSDGELPEGRIGEPPIAIPGTLPAAIGTELGNLPGMLTAAGAGMFSALPFLMDPRRMGIPLEQPQNGTKGANPRPFKAYPKEPLSMPLGYYGLPGVLPALDPATAQTLTSGTEELFNRYRQFLSKNHDPKRPITKDTKLNMGSMPISPPHDVQASVITPPVGSGVSTSSESSLSPPAVKPSQGSLTSTPCSRKRGRAHPEDKKDDAYWERRRKNNEAAKRSRDARRAKEDEIAIRAAFLEQENLKLRVEVAALKNETAKLRCMLYNS